MNSISQNFGPVFFDSFGCGIFFDAAGGGYRYSLSLVRREASGGEVDIVAGFDNPEGPESPITMRERLPAKINDIHLETSVVQGMVAGNRYAATVEVFRGDERVAVQVFTMEHSAPNILPWFLK